MTLHLCQKLTLWERIQEAVWPPLRRAREARLRAMIRHLTHYPRIPVVFEDEL